MALSREKTSETLKVYLCQDVASTLKLQYKFKLLSSKNDKPHCGDSQLDLKVPFL